jgi:hypothetical protein
VQVGVFKMCGEGGVMRGGKGGVGGWAGAKVGGIVYGVGVWCCVGMLCCVGMCG